MAERFLLAWLDRKNHLERATVSPIRRAIEDQVTAPADQVEIDIWLDSPGGDAHAAYKLALTLRAAASKIRVVVPDYAKSAATLLTIGGHEIYVAAGADLGPLDAQMPDEGSYTGSISALNIARAADEVARDAVEMAVTGGADLLEITGLSRAQTIEAMLGFTSRFSEPLVRQLDPKVVHHAKQMLQVTAKYAERLLRENGCADPEKIARQLVETFPTHGYVISRDEASELGLPIHPFEEYEFADSVRKLHRAAESGGSVRTFCPLEDVVNPTPKATPKATKQGKGGGSNGQPQRRRTAGAGSARAGASSRNGK